MNGRGHIGGNCKGGVGEQRPGHQKWGVRRGQSQKIQLKARPSGPILALLLLSYVTPGNLSAPAYSLGYCARIHHNNALKCLAKCQAPRKQTVHGSSRDHFMREKRPSFPTLEHPLREPVDCISLPSPSYHQSQPSIDQVLVKWEWAWELCISTRPPSVDPRRGFATKQKDTAAYSQP